MKIEKILPDSVVYSVGKQRMGNTKVSTVCVWEVYVVSVNVETGIVVASWNNNVHREYGKRSWSKWRATKPLLVKSGFGYRLATRDEIKAQTRKESECPR